MDHFDTKIASLTYLTNPLYQKSMKKHTQPTKSNNKSDIKFYRKRITALTKDMLKGEIPDNNFIKTIYETYVNGLIQYFKMVDTSDIIQQQYVEANEVGPNGIGANGIGANGIGSNALYTIEEVSSEEDTNGVDTNGVDANAVIKNTVDKKEITINNMNDRLMRKPVGVATLDNFVIKQPNESKDTRIIPFIIEVDLKEPSLKKKGVKEKVKKGAE
jgi:hypothetical protein